MTYKDINQQWHNDSTVHARMTAGEFARYIEANCANCSRQREEHATNQKCLFQPTVFKPRKMAARIYRIWAREVDEGATPLTKMSAEIIQPRLFWEREMSNE